LLLEEVEEVRSQRLRMLKTEKGVRGDLPRLVHLPLRRGVVALEPASQKELRMRITNGAQNEEFVFSHVLNPTP